MNRRAFLGGVGSLASLGTLAYATRDPIETLEVCVWLSERAATYDGVRTRIREFLKRSLEFEFWSVAVSFGEPVSVSTEDGARVTTRGEWPLTVGAGAVGLGDVDPATNVNLLVTDGQMAVAPTGYGLPRIASVGGARHVAALESYDEIVDADDPRRIVPLTTETRTMQVLVHEVGHALGLEHDHGVAFRHGDAVVATPMISTYAFDPDHPVDRTQCGTAYSVPEGTQRALSLSFSACSRRALAALADGEAETETRTKTKTA